MIFPEKNLENLDEIISNSSFSSSSKNKKKINFSEEIQQMQIDKICQIFTKNNDKIDSELLKIEEILFEFINLKNNNKLEVFPNYSILLQIFKRFLKILNEFVQKEKYLLLEINENILENLLKFLIKVYCYENLICSKNYLDLICIMKNDVSEAISLILYKIFIKNPSINCMENIINPLKQIYLKNANFRDNFIEIIIDSLKKTADYLFFKLEKKYKKNLKFLQFFFKFIMINSLKIELFWLCKFLLEFLRIQENTTQKSPKANKFVRLIESKMLKKKSNKDKTETNDVIIESHLLLKKVFLSTFKEITENHSDFKDKSDFLTENFVIFEHFENIFFHKNFENQDFLSCVIHQVWRILNL